MIPSGVERVPVEPFSVIFDEDSAGTGGGRRRKSDHGHEERQKLVTRAHFYFAPLRESTDASGNKGP